MRSAFFRPTAFLFCSALFLSNPFQSNSQEQSEPQLVRVVNAQGEVKFSPGKNGKPDLGNDWMTAPVGLTVEEGYSIATENGRAVLEFENGSVVYVAEHSVLQFDKLQIKKQVTTSKLNLVTGTMTVAHVSGGQDQFVVGTPTAKMTLRDAQTVRLDSTLNGLIVHDIDTPLPLNETSRHSKSELQPGEAVAYVDGLRIPLKGPMNHPESDAWDKWVDAQRLERAAAIKKGLEEAGLKEPIPGLAQLAEQGHFFDCPPYGKCWEPNAQVADALANAGEPTGMAADVTATTGPRSYVINRTLMNRCPMESWMYSVGRPSRPGLLAANEPEETFRISSFPWSSCFAGSWLMDDCWNVGVVGPGRVPGFGYPVYCPNRMVYVVGHRHKRPPCRIVRTGHGWGLVPRHPLDRKGQPPLNAKHGILTLAVGKNGVVGRIEPAPSKGLHWETNLPKEFAAERNLTASEPKVPAPVIQGRMIQLASNGAKLAVTQATNDFSDIRYDYKNKNFVATRVWNPTAVGGRTPGQTVVMAHVGTNGVGGGVTGHGSGGWAGGSGTGSGASHGGFGGASGGSGGGHSSGGSSGGGGHASGGGSGGGGGSGHSGGGGSSGGGSSGGGGGASSGGGASHH